MAKKDDKSSSSYGVLRKLATQVGDGLNSIYKSTYYSSPVNTRDLKNIKDEINSSINNITTINMQQIGEPNISKLYTRLQSQLEDPEFKKGLEDMFSDKESMDSIMHTYIENKYLKDLDVEIDTICKYQPKLIEALETKKDNVLSADHFTKDFINPINNTSVNQTTFEKRCDLIKDKYDFLAQAEVWYMNASKYGEQFLYIVPYNRAIRKLLDRVGSTMSYVQTSGDRYTNITSTSVLKEQLESASTNVIHESFAFTNKPSSNIIDLKSHVGMDREPHINVELDMNCMITESILETYRAFNEAKTVREQSLCLEHTRIIEEAAIMAEANGNKKDSIKITPTIGGTIKTRSNFNKTIKDNDFDSKEFQFDDPVAQDGFMNANKLADEKLDKTDEIKVPGCIIKKLDRIYVKPYYIEDLCLGYFYMELKKNQTFDFDNTGMDGVMSAKRLNKMLIDDEKEQDIILKQTAANISKAVTPKFINGNADISKEIYMILKYNDMYNTNGNDTIKITFLPADDVVHIKFKEDPNTHRGISDLEYSLFPAKLRSLIQLTYAIANMTRGYDKRVYYVKQSVETNIAKTLLNTINQLKRSNFNLRQVENIQTIFNLTGILNDYLIPTLGGDPPIQFEVMPGQRIEPPTELLNELEETMINPTDVPLELLQARQSMDYAVHYSMTNTKFLRKIYHRQGQYQRFLSTIFSKCYNYENDTDDYVEIQLPPPVFLNITNTNQIISNTNEFSEQIAAIKMADEPNEMVRNIFTKKTKLHYLNSYLDINILDRFEEESRQEAAIKSGMNQEQ